MSATVFGITVRGFWSLPDPPIDPTLGSLTVKQGCGYMTESGTHEVPQEPVRLAYEAPAVVEREPLVGYLGAFYGSK